MWGRACRSSATCRIFHLLVPAAAVLLLHHLFTHRSLSPESAAQHLRNALMPYACCYVFAKHDTAIPINLETHPRQGGRRSHLWWLRETSCPSRWARPLHLEPARAWFGVTRPSCATTKIEQQHPSPGTHGENMSSHGHTRVERRIHSSPVVVI